MSSSARHRSPYSAGEKLLRIIWSVCSQSLFRWSPRPCWNFRNWLLRVFGARIGSKVHIHNTVRISFPWKLTVGDHTAIGEDALIYNLGPVTIGRYVTISQRSHLCAGTHDYSSREMTLIRAKIQIEDDAWVCADAFVGPHVTICPGAIVAARGVVMHDVPAWTIVRGNPAVFVKPRCMLDQVEFGQIAADPDLREHRDIARE